MYLPKNSKLLWLGAAAVNQGVKVVTHPPDKEVIRDFREPLSALLQPAGSHMQYCLTQETKVA